jgi:two-component system response regulator NreC
MFMITFFAQLDCRPISIFAVQIVQMSKKRILIVDDHQLIIDGMKGFFENHDKYQVVGEGNTGADAVRLVPILRPDVLLMDIEMPELSGIQASEEIKKKYPEVKIIIISMHDEKQLIKKLLDRGVDGYLLKNSDRTEVFDAIERVLSGKTYLSQDAAESLLEKSGSAAQTKISQFSSLSELTERELEIFKWIAGGETNKEIGDRLKISYRTVDTHRTNIMKKLNVNNVAGLVKIAFQNGLMK